MQFIDYVKIYVKSGDGGRGCVSFRREKNIPKGGPNGGDGGNGGDVIIKSTKELNTLLDFKYHKEYKADNGEHGKGSNKHGKDGDDIVILVPIGTIIRDVLTDQVIIDIDKDKMEFMIATGGKGGLGNSNFATSTRQAPRFAQPGIQGEERTLILELKLLADVGLIGLPNAGKSTLISVISSAKPKIADYPFTTLTPNLGVVKYNDFRSFVVADIPGLIEGASQGVGLGFQFLRHIERTSILLHIIDISDMAQGSPVRDFEKINKELLLYNPNLAKKEMIVVATKLDVATKIDGLKKYCKDKGIDFFAVSAVTKQGINKLVKHLSMKISEGKG